MPAWRVSELALVVVLIKASRASVLVLLGALLLRYANSQLSGLQGFVNVLVGAYLTSYLLDLLLKDDIGKGRSSTTGWRFWVRVEGCWHELKTETGVICMEGQKRRVVDYANDLFGLLIYGFSTVGQRDMILHGRGHFSLVPYFHPKPERAIRGSRDVVGLTSIEAWHSSGDCLSLQVAGHSGGYKRLRDTDEEGEDFDYMFRVIGVTRSPLVYSPAQEMRHLTTHFAASTEATFE